MRLLRRVRRLLIRHTLAVAALFAQLVAATGAPIFPSHTLTKNGSVTFPCQNHPCGCATHDQCWAGDCCCFTLEQKLTWAEEHGVDPPPHVRPMIEARQSATKPKQKPKPPCCTKHDTTAKHACCETNEHAEPVAAVTEESNTPTVRWIAGVLAQKCHGDGPAGLFKFEGGIAPAASFGVRVTRPNRDFGPQSDSHANSTSFRPPTRPPRLS